VDTVGFNATNAGTVWSFAPSTLSVNPAQVTSALIAGYNPGSLSFSLTSATPVPWTAAVTGPSWLAVTPTSGISPTNIAVSFATAALAVGQYTNNIEFAAGSSRLEVPVRLNVKPLNVTKMVADQQRPYLYAIQPPPLSGQNGLLLFINTTNGNIDKTLSIGVNPVDLAIHYPEGRLYIASWTETWTYVVDLNTRTLLPSLNLGTDIYKINAGRAGPIVTEGEDQWIAVNLINTADGSVAGPFPGPEREGDGAADPAGVVYYHSDNDISNAHIHKFMMTNDIPVEVAASNERASGTRNLVSSADGGRLFWNGYVYDTNLVELGRLGTEIYSCSSDGSVAFSSSQAFDTTTRQAIYKLPVPTSVSIVDGQNQRFWYFDSTNATLGSVPVTTVKSPTITQQPPANTSVSVGGPVYLTVTAMGLAPLSYQWTMSGTNIPGATNYFLSTPNAQPAMQGDYNAVVTNPFGYVTSAVARVTVLARPSIASLSASTNVLAGQSFSLSVTPAGTAPFAYRWMFENAGINGGTNQVLTINIAQAANEGIYRVVVTNAAGSVTSAPVSVRIPPAAPSIVSNPASLSVAASSNATFAVNTVGSQPLSYQWFFQGAPIVEATSSQYSLSRVQAANSGAYQVVVANSLGSVTSVVATLTVTALAPYFTTQPVGAVVSAGSSRTLSGLANGSLPIGYQWQRNGVSLAGATQTSLLLANLATSDSAVYTLVASNVAGVSTSAVAQITVYQPPTLVVGLTNQVVDINRTVTLAVNVLGSPTLVYSWRLNSQPIAGSSSALSLTNIQPWQSGYYQVTITNSYGSISSTGRVSVLGWPSAVTAWGDNSGGQTNVARQLNDLVAVAGGDYHSTALRHDGTLVAWGYNGDHQTDVPTNALRLVTVACGAAHNLAITERGSVAAWGRNDSGQCSVPGAAGNNVLAVAAGEAHSLALLSSGAVLSWGDNSFGQCAVPAGLSGVQAIAAGRNHSLALRTNGTVVGWGFNAYGQASAPVLSNAVAIAGGYLHSAALLANGVVVVWGDNSFGQANVPTGLSNLTAIAAGDFHTLALWGEGSVIGWGDDRYGQIDVPGALSHVAALASGNYHGLALVPALGVLQPSLVGSRLVVRWSGSGTLQWAPTPAGPYLDITDQGTAYTNQDRSAPAKFFRLRR
jgi:hypothetical protein